MTTTSIPPTYAESPGETGHDLVLDGLTRRFGDLLAVDDVSFSVPAGRLTGFVGGNGAGKTTTMRLLMGLLDLHGGEVRWGGRPVAWADRTRFGYMPEERGLYPKQKVLDQLVHLGRLKGMGARDARRSATALLERFGLAERTTDPVEKLSLGNQQRVQVIAAVMAEPTALVLDEPFSGLDPTAADDMADLLREHAARGVPVLFSSHQLDLVDRLCDRLVVMAGGRVRAEGTAEELRAHAPRRHRLSLGSDAGWVRGHAGVHVVDLDGATVLLEVPGSPAEVDGTLQTLLAEALRRGSVHELTRVVPPLSEIYREVTA